MPASRYTFTDSTASILDIMPTAADFIRSGQRTVKLEADSILTLHDRINADFASACDLIMGCEGRTVITGMGKSGHIGKKIAATLASTGSPAFFVHPGEASHGDLGMVTGKDVVIALSNSGKTPEVITILPLFKRMGAKLISMTGDPASPLAKEAIVNLDVSVAQEACPHDLAPTTSTTATLVMGDALAIALLEARGFSPEDFAFSHPGGSLGRRLLIKVADLMHAGEQLPVVEESTLLREALLEMTRKGLGMTTVIGEHGQLTGVFTDGDLRRVLDHEVDIARTRIREVMTSHGQTIHPDRLAAEALLIMEENRINGIIAVDADDRPIGALNMHDLLKAGVA